MPDAMAPPRDARRALAAQLAPHLAHLAVVLLVFSDLVFRGRMLYFRDVSASYYPDLVFLARSLGQGVWPLWNPTSDAGAPFLAPYPVTVLAVWALGPSGALRALPALHVLLAMTGTTALARERGCSGAAAWASGALLGLSGFVQSTLLYPVFLAQAWAPFILLAWLRVGRTRSARPAAAMGALAALQISTFGAEVVLQTALAALLLRPPRGRRAFSGLGLAAVLGLLLAAPAIAGAFAMLAGSARGSGFPPEVGLSYSAHPLVLAEALLPRLFGDPHTFSDLGYWGQPFFPEGSPLVPSLYLGLPALLLAFLAGRDRLWWLVAAGTLLSLGSHGPLGPLLVPLFRHLRAPVKFFFLVSLATALLAGRGLDRARAGEARRGLVVLLPALALLLVAGLAALAPDAVAGSLGWLSPVPLDWRASIVVSQAWPAAFARSGLLCAAAGLALLAGPSLRPLAALAALADLLVVGLPLNPAVDPSFYELRPEVRALVEPARAEGQYRWFSCGLKATPPARWNPRVAALNSDYWLYALDRQALLPRSHVLDGLEGAFDEDRTGLLPPGAALPVAERDPSRLGRYAGRLRVANVRWIVSLAELPGALVVPRGEARLGELLDPIRLYELRGALPRAAFVARYEVVPRPGEVVLRLEQPDFDPRESVLLESPPARLSPEASAASGDAASVEYEMPDPHTVRLRLLTPPGLVVVSQGFDEGWRAEGPEGPVPILRANGRYWALPTPGGERRYLVRYRPAWLPPSLLLLGLGSLAALVVGIRGAPRPEAAEAGRTLTPRIRQATMPRR